MKPSDSLMKPKDAGLVPVIGRLYEANHQRKVFISIIRTKACGNAFSLFRGDADRQRGFRVERDASQSAYETNHPSDGWKKPY